MSTPDGKNNPDGMKKKKKSVVPVYAIGLVWLSYSLSGKLTSFGGLISCAALSAAAYLIAKIFFPDKEMTEEELAAEQEAEQKKKEEAEEKARKKKEEAEKKAQKQAKKEPVKPAAPRTQAEELLEQGAQYVARIQELNDEIPDYKLSAQIKQIEILTQKIFDYVRAHPEKAKGIKQFMNYYLPTTIKLLEQYVVLQNQGLRMGNIDDGMKKIEDMLDKVIVAFQKQLDSLFESDVVDITADIRVMEQMMASQGLTGNDITKE